MRCARSMGGGVANVRGRLGLYGNPVVCLGRVYRGVPRLEDTRLCGRSGCRILRGYRLARRCGHPILYRIPALLTGRGGILPVILHNLPVVQMDCTGALRRNLRIIRPSHPKRDTPHSNQPHTGAFILPF